MGKIINETVIFEGDVVLEKLPEGSDYEPSVFFVQDEKILYSLNLNSYLRGYAGKTVQIVVRPKGKEDEA